MHYEHRINFIHYQARRGQKNVIGEIYSRFEKAGLRIVAAKKMQLTQAQAEEFYGVHRERPFSMT